MHLHVGGSPRLWKARPLSHVRRDVHRACDEGGAGTCVFVSTSKGEVRFRFELLLSTRIYCSKNGEKVNFTRGRVLGIAALFHAHTSCRCEKNARDTHPARGEVPRALRFHMMNVSEVRSATRRCMRRNRRRRGRRCPLRTSPRRNRARRAYRRDLPDRRNVPWVYAR